MLQQITTAIVEKCPLVLPTSHVRAREHGQPDRFNLWRRSATRCRAVRIHTNLTEAIRPMPRRYCPAGPGDPPARRGLPTRPPPPCGHPERT